VGLNGDLGFVGAVDEDALGLIAPPRPWSSEAGGRRKHAGVSVAADDLELPPLGDRRLVDVAAEDQFGAGAGEPVEQLASSRHRSLPTPPRRSRELVVQRDDPQHTGLHGAKASLRPLEITAQYPAALVAPRRDRAEAHHEQLRRGMDVVGAPVPLEFPERMREPARREERDVVVAGNDEERNAEFVQVTRGGFVLGRPAAVREVTGRDHERGPSTLDERADSLLEHRVVKPVPRAEMEVGHVEDAC